MDFKLQNANLQQRTDITQSPGNLQPRIYTYVQSASFFTRLTSSRHNLEMGRSKIPFCALILTLLIKPSCPGNVCTTNPRGQRFLGVFLELISTKSPDCKFLRGESHFCLSCSDGRYSFIHLLQNTSLR